MGKTAQISKEKRQSAITLRNEGQSLRKIARTLQLSVTAVAKTVKRFEQTGTHEDRKRSGRPRVTSKSENKFIRVTSLRNRRLTAPEIQAQLNATRSTDVSTSTVQRRLRDAGLKGRIAAKKPLLRIINTEEEKTCLAQKKTETGHLRSGSHSYGRTSPNSKYLDQTAECL